MAPSMTSRKVCPYLGTVARPLLDFDFEKQCSISLVREHVYGCLVCGKYFEGRGPGTFAHTHALELEHYMFIHLKTTKVYCLPDDYEVEDASLADVKRYLNPLRADLFSSEFVKSLWTIPLFKKGLDGQDFRVGLLGLNDLKKTGYMNVVLQVLCRIPVLVEFFLPLDLDRQQKPDEVLLRLSELMRKIYNVDNFKGFVSPHEFVHAVMNASQRQFKIGIQNDPGDFLLWVLHRLHKRLKSKSLTEYGHRSMVSDNFQLEMEVTTNPPPPKDGEEMGQVEVQRVKSFLLHLDVPSQPVFANSLDDNMIPQIQIFELLKKFNGSQETMMKDSSTKTYRITKLPQYLIIKHNRFSKNEFYLEKNSTIVTFPLKNLDLRKYLHPSSHEDHPITRYTLLASITHQGRPDDGDFAVHVFHEVTGEWLQCKDLRIEPVLPGDVAISATYIQVWKLEDE